MSVTHPISGAANALKATPALPANSSLADFLLAGAPGNAGQDFQAIAAALFGVASTSPAKTQASAKDWIAKDDHDTRKSKDASDATPVLATHPELTAPITNIPRLDVPPPSAQSFPDQVAPEPSPTVGTLTLGATDARLGGLAVLGNRVEIKDDTPAQPEGNTASVERLVPSEAWTNTLPSTIKQQDVKSSAPVKGDGTMEMQSSQGEGRAPFAQTPLMQPAAQDVGKQGKKDAPDVFSLFDSGTAGKKSGECTKPANDRSEEAGAHGATKDSSTQPPTIVQPTLRVDAKVAASLNELHLVVTDAVPIAPLPAQPSVVPETPARPVVATVPLQASAADTGQAADSKGAASRISASESAKIKDRSNNGRDGKDTRIATGVSGKSVFSQASQIAAGSTNSGGGNSSSKDLSGTVLPNHSGAHAKADSSRQTAGSLSSSTAAAEMDGPDEALPTAASSPLTAKLVQGLSQSEFRVGMQSQEFGKIDIRTFVARHLFSAQISVEHSDVAKSLATELPALYSKLVDQHVSVANIVIQGGQSLATWSGLSQDAQPQSWRPQSSHNTSSSGVETISPMMTEMFDSTGRLDVRI